MALDDFNDFLVFPITTVAGRRVMNSGGASPRAEALPGPFSLALSVQWRFNNDVHLQSFIAEFETHGYTRPVTWEPPGFDEGEWVFRSPMTLTTAKTPPRFIMSATVDRFNAAGAFVPVFSAAAQAYFDALDAAGARLTQYDAANATLIDSLVALGGAYWDNASSIVALGGKDFAGLTIPLRVGMIAPSNTGSFVSGDLSAATGLQGNGTSKYLDSNIANNANLQNDFAMWCWVTGNPAATVFQGLMGTANAAAARSQIASDKRTPTPGTNQAVFRARNLSGASAANSTAYNTGLWSVNRASSTEFTWRAGAATGTATITSETPGTGKIDVFRRDVDYFNGGIVIYGIGPSLDIAVLQPIIAAWVAAISA